MRETREWSETPQLCSMSDVELVGGVTRGGGEGVENAAGLVVHFGLLHASVEYDTVLIFVECAVDVLFLKDVK